MRLILTLALLFIGLAHAQSAPHIEKHDFSFLSNAEAAAKKIDALVLAQLKKHKVEPNAAATDSEFLRRTYLNIVGRIPTLEESKTFLDSESRGKRSRLIHQLLDSKGYVSHHYNYWADILRSKSRLPGMRGTAGEPFIKYIKESLAANKPYDEWVEEMLTSHGDTWNTEDRASGFWRRDRGMPLDRLAVITQTFLGTQMACAQCHNHPFDKWTQKQFFEMAAFTSMPRQTRPKPGMMGGQAKSEGNDFSAVQRHFLLKARESGKDVRSDPSMRFLFTALRDTFGNTVPNEGYGLIKLPKDYGYNDAKPGDIIRS